LIALFIAIYSQCSKLDYVQLAHTSCTERIRGGDNTYGWGTDGGPSPQKNLHKRSAEAFLRDGFPSVPFKRGVFSPLQFIYVALNELIGYTVSKDIADYTAKDFWIRFLSNYAEDME